MEIPHLPLLQSQTALRDSARSKQAADTQLRVPSSIQKQQSSSAAQPCMQQASSNGQVTGSSSGCIMGRGTGQPKRKASTTSLGQLACCGSKHETVADTSLNSLILGSGIGSTASDITTHQHSVTPLKAVSASDHQHRAADTCRGAVLATGHARDRPSGGYAELDHTGPQTAQPIAGGPGPQAHDPSRENSSRNPSDQPIRSEAVGEHQQRKGCIAKNLASSELVDESVPAGDVSNIRADGFTKQAPLSAEQADRNASRACILRSVKQQPTAIANTSPAVAQTSKRAHVTGASCPPAMPAVMKKSRRLCRHEDCNLHACFNLEGCKGGRYCNSHKQPGMVDVRSKRCAQAGCTTQASFNHSGLQQLYCSKHKQLGMVNVRSR